MSCKRAGMWLGGDVSKGWVDVAVGLPEVATQDWAALPKVRVDFDEGGVHDLLAWLSGQGIDRADIGGVCVESTGRLSRRWADLLGERLGPVSIVNPMLPKAYGQSLGIREKSDWRDACTLALFGREHRPKPTVTPLKEQRQLRELSRLYTAVQADWQAYRLRLSDGPETPSVKRELRAMIRGLEARLKRLAKEMDAIIDRNEQLRQDAECAESIIGVGRTTMRVVLAEFGDLRTFKRNELVSYAGLYPSEYTSGSSVHRQPHLVKRGGGRLRSALFMCALSAKSKNPHMRAFAERLEAHGKAPMAALGAVMRKLLLLIRTLIVNQEHYDPTHGFQKPS